MTAESLGLKLDQVVFAYPQLRLTFDVAIRADTVTAVMGPSGSGKSTLLDLIAGLKRPASGRVLAGDRDVTGLAPDERPISMIFQENNLFAHLDVASNVGLGRSSSLKLDTSDQQAVSDALRQTGLEGKDKRLPRELSGGERQRVAIARVLVRDRPILLLDEPFAALGPALRDEMLDIIRDLQRQKALTVLLVTHHPQDALRIADDIVFVEAGVVAAHGPAHEFFDEGGPEPFRRYIGSLPS